MAKLDVDHALLRKLATMMEETGLTEIEVQSGTQSVRLSRAAPAAAASVQTMVATAPAQAQAAPPQAGAGADAPLPPGAITAPMVGTAYLAPEPGAAPFVQLGDRVQKGQTLLIIEAMKVMNPIAAPQAGIVSQILVANGAPVEFGEPLAILEKG